MFSGDWASDMVSNGAVGNAMRLGAELNNAGQHVNKLSAELIETNSSNAANLAMRYALAAQLKQFDPENPLLTDGALVDKVKEAGRRAVDKEHSFDAAREVGKNYPVPGRDKAMARPRMQPPTVIPANERINDAYAAAIAVRNALAAQLLRIDPSNPLLQDDMLLERLKACGTSAYRMCGDNFEAARQVGNTFVIPGRE